MYTKQEVFDKVVNHLRTQGCKSADSNGRCLYRGPNGTKCAVGCLIEDSDYTESLEDRTVSFLVENTHVLDNYKEQQNLLARMQTIHDNYKIQDWENRFQNAASDYNVEYTAPEPSLENPPV